MIGYSNAISADLHRRPEELRRAAANHAAGRAARSEARHAARKAAAAAALQRDQVAAFSWEAHQVKHRLNVAKLVSRAR